MIAFLRQTWLIAKREFLQLLSTPMFWVLSGLFFFASSLVFLGLIIGFSNPNIRQEHDLSVDITISVISQLFWILHYFLMIQAPMLTMRSIAEEKRMRTMNLLQTTPVSEWSIVTGKFLANAGALLTYLAVTLVFPLITDWISDPDWAVIGACYAALALSVFAYVALGVFVSSLTDSQVIAAVVTYVILFALLIVSTLADSFGIGSLTMIAQHLTLMAHVDGFLEGNVEVLDIAYFTIFSFVFLYFAVRQLESTRWRN